MNTSNVIRLQKSPDGASAAIRSLLDNGRHEIVTAGPNPEFMFMGSDPYETNVGTGVVVPTTPSGSLNDVRYLFLLARESFGTGEHSSTGCGARLVGIRQYAELVARIPGRTAPLATNSGPPTGSTVVFRKEITTALWHPFDGDISWHVMVIPRTQRDSRNPANADGVMFEDALSPALLYQTFAGTFATPTAYTPPNGGRPWGISLAASLGNIHDLRYKWRSEYAEQALDIPVPAPCDVALFASVRQNDPDLNPTLDTAGDCALFSALGPEDQFVVAYPTFAQYGVIAGSLVFEDNIGRDVP